MQRRKQLEGYAWPVGLAAGVVLLLAAFLPWVTVHYRTRMLALDGGVTAFSSWHGKLTVIAGLSVIAASVVRVRSSTAERRQAASGLAIGVGIAALGACFHQVFLAHPAAVAGSIVRTTSSPGIGLYLSLAASAAALAAGIFGAHPEPAVEHTPMEQVEPEAVSASANPR
jgi:hypothetical protein